MLAQPCGNKRDAARHETGRRNILAQRQTHHTETWLQSANHCLCYDILAFETLHCCFERCCCLQHAKTLRTQNNSLHPGLHRKAKTHTAAEARFRFRDDNSKGSIRTSSGRSKIAGLTNPGAARPSKAKTNIAIGHMFVLSLVVTRSQNEHDRRARVTS